MARMSMLYPRGPYDFGGRIQELPEDGSVPGMPDWRWIATPGHSPGHVSFFRDSDRALIAGDAFCTQKQESLIGVITKHQGVFGPPKYFTPDFVNAFESVRRIADLEPEVGMSGHGIPMRGEALRDGLRTLADHFDDLGLPEHGRYLDKPAVTDEQGVISVPPAPPDPVPKILLGAAVVAALAALVAAMRDKDE